MREECIRWLIDEERFIAVRIDPGEAPTMLDILFSVEFWRLALPLFSAVGAWFH